MMYYYLCHEDRITEMCRSAEGFSINGTPQRKHMLLSYPCSLPPEHVATLVDRVRAAYGSLKIRYTVDAFSYLLIWVEW
jgi:hypothetical protein